MDTTPVIEDAALGQIDPSSVNYMDASTAQNDFCAKCIFFMQPDRCSKLSGTINPHGWCQIYTDYDSDGDNEVAPEGGPAKAEAAEAAESVTPVPVPAKTHVLSEALDLSEATVDAEARTIRNVKLITAGMSLNRRMYSEKVLSSAAPIFEGLKAYADHPAPKASGRSIRDLTGWYENVKFDGKRLVGDRHFLDNAAGNDVFAVARAIVEKKAPPTLAGLSINAVGTGRSAKDDRGDYLEVETITSAVSVDDVDTPAAGGGYLLTASADDPLVKGMLETLSYQEWFDARPEYRKRLQNEIKDVRKDDVLKAAQAEAENARADLKSAQDALSEAQTQLTTAQNDHAAAVAQWATERRGLLIDAVLAAAALPKLYEDDLRKRLATLEESAWPDVIATERQKAKSKPITGSGQQVNQQPALVQVRPKGVDPLDMVSDPEKFAESLSKLKG